MDYLKDPQFLMMILILPSLFSLTLVGEGINRLINYDNRGWLSITAGGCFMILLIAGFFVLGGKELLSP